MGSLCPRVSRVKGPLKSRGKGVSVIASIADASASDSQVSGSKLVREVF